MWHFFGSGCTRPDPCTHAPCPGTPAAARWCGGCRGAAGAAVAVRRVLGTEVEVANSATRASAQRVVGWTTVGGVSSTPEPLPQPRWRNRPPPGLRTQKSSVHWALIADFPPRGPSRQRPAGASRGPLLRIQHLSGCQPESARFAANIRLDTAHSGAVPPSLLDSSE
jgi:hypothetical protein